jgi:hypothetical protein
MTWPGTSGRPSPPQRANAPASRPASNGNSNRRHANVTGSGCLLPHPAAHSVPVVPAPSRLRLSSSPQLSRSPHQLLWRASPRRLASGSPRAHPGDLLGHPGEPAGLRFEHRSVHRHGGNTAPSGANRTELLRQRLFLGPRPPPTRSSAAGSASSKKTRPTPPGSPASPTPSRRPGAVSRPPWNRTSGPAQRLAAPTWRVTTTVALIRTPSTGMTLSESPMATSHGFSPCGTSPRPRIREWPRGSVDSTHVGAPTT